MKLNTIALMSGVLAFFGAHMAHAEGRGCDQGVYFSEPMDAWISESGLLKLSGVTSDVHCLGDSLLDHQIVLTVFAASGTSVLQGQATLVEQQVKSEGGALRTILNANFDLKSLAVSGKVWMKISIDGREYDYVQESRAAKFDFNNLRNTSSESGVVTKGQFLSFGASKPESSTTVPATPKAPAPAAPVVNQVPVTQAPVVQPPVKQTPASTSGAKAQQRKAAIQQRIQALQAQILVLQGKLNSY